MNLLNKKEQLFVQYYETTESAIASLDPEEVATLVEHRDELISQINEIDSQAGTCEINANIEQMIVNIQDLDQQLNKKLERLKVEAQDRIQSFKNAQKIKNQYEPTYALTDGAFYDKRR